MIKICPRCKEGKEQNSKFYYKNRKSKSGFSSYCIGCYLIRSKEIKLPLISSPSYTKKDLLKSRWSGIRGRHIFKGYEDVKVLISRKRFYEKFNNEELDQLFNQWVFAGKQLRLTPSIDRINPDGHYEESNMRWIPFFENAGRARHTNQHLCKKIMKLSKDAEILATYPSLKEAIRDLHISNAVHCNISACAKGKIPTAYGFKWKFV